MESTLLNGGGYVNLNIGMEIVPADGLPENHSKLEKQVQQLSIGQTNVDFDTMRVCITGADDKYFKIRLPIDSENEFVSDEIVAGGDAN